VERSAAGRLNGDVEGKMVPGQGLNFSDLEARLPWLFLALYGLFGTGLLVALAVRLANRMG